MDQPCCECGESGVCLVEPCRDTHDTPAVSVSETNDSHRVCQVEAEKSKPIASEKLLRLRDLAARSLIPKKTRQERIREFTQATSDVPLPVRPQMMSREQVHFLVKMHCEELKELLATVYDSEVDIQEKLVAISHQSRNPQIRVFKNDTDVIANQVDALVDIDYFSGNAASKVGWDMDEVFDVVHEANMAKKHEDGTFHKVDGKVTKPPGWTPPDVEKVVRRWISE